MDEWKSAYTSAGWRYLLWNSTDLLRLNSGKGLANSHQFKEMPQWSGKCNIARYEILYELEGIYIDADTKFLRIIDELLLEQDSFCCYENEIIRPGLASNGYLGCSPKCELMETLIKKDKQSAQPKPSFRSRQRKDIQSRVLGYYWPRPTYQRNPGTTLTKDCCFTKLLLHPKPLPNLTSSRPIQRPLQTIRQFPMGEHSRERIQLRRRSVNSANHKHLHHNK